MSALDFGGGVGSNASRYFTYTSPAFTNADWCIGARHRRTAVTGSSEQGLFSIGTPEATDSLYLYTGEASWANGPLGGRALNAAGVEWYNTSPGVTLPQDGRSYLVICQRRGGFIEWYIVKEGDAAAAIFTSAAVSGTLSSGAGIIGIGGGGDDFRGPLGEFFILTGDSLSASEITTLAGGKHIDVVRPNRLVDLRFRDGALATEKNRGTGGATYDATAVGTGYTTTDEFFPEGNPATIHQEVRRPRPRRYQDLGLALDGWNNTAKWLDPLLDVATGGPVTITTAPGNAVADGTTAQINQQRVIGTTTGAAVADGVTATINAARIIGTNPGNAVANGATAAIDQQRKVTTTTGSAVADGAGALIDQRRVIATTPGNAVADGVTANVSGSVTISTTTGNAVADGVTAVVNQARVIATSTGNAVANGATAAIDQQRKVTTTTGNAVADGVPATVNAQRNIAASVGDATAAGITATINNAVTVATTPGNATAAGITASISGSTTIGTTPGDAVAAGVTATIVVDTGGGTAPLPPMSGGSSGGTSSTSQRPHSGDPQQKWSWLPVEEIAQNVITAAAVARADGVQATIANTPPPAPPAPPAPRYSRAFLQRDDELLLLED